MSLSVIIPACNEGRYIHACLSAILASEGPEGVQVIVAANGCTDDTVALSMTRSAVFEDRGWRLDVLDLPALGKMGALDAGDAVAQFPTRVYVDADVVVSPPLLAQLAQALATEAPRYASGTPVVTAIGWSSKAFARLWVKLPFVTEGVPGFGVYAVNGAGRARWGTFPQIISDDTYVRVQFAPEERVKVPATYDWPLVEGFDRLVRVRRRQDQGVVELHEIIPAQMANEGKDAPSRGWLLRQAVADPVAFGVYAAVKLAVKAGWGRQTGWVRGR
ncbi:glycosyltransferase family 2 protein [Pararhodobacter sp. CCB-MM2]|uniref:glycosyltransferase n=1 Tax=Pararhodobacter sp. CCB-MM2 TaxID=1786003 RepID=UPI0008296F88|nr:glycosyltransferase [Pararhodobacter sp. CCB-MM2]